MPYVRRNTAGTIIGYTITQQTDAMEFLGVNHPEMAKFLSEYARARTIERRVQKDHESLREVMLGFNLHFSELELALSALLYVILNTPKSQVAYAIYYSPTSFDARVEIVENALIQVISENDELTDLAPLWATIRAAINKCRNLRNAIAHSSPVTHAIHGKKYARLSPPAFDVIRVGRILAKRQIPGLSANDIKLGRYKLIWAEYRVDEVNRLMTAFHSKDPSLPEKFDELRAGLKKSDSP